MLPADKGATTSCLNCLHFSMFVCHRGDEFPPEYCTAVEVMHNTLQCLRMHGATRDSLLPKCIMVPVKCESADKINGSSQSYSVQLAQLDSRATSIHAGSTNCASHKDLRLWDG